MSKEDTKQIIVMRKDLNMRKGKMCSQAAHASMAFLTKKYRRGAIVLNDEYTFDQVAAISLWLDLSFKKIVVYVNSEKELLEIRDMSEKEGLITVLITDNGATEFNGVPTKTCLSIGPDYCDKIDKITGDLPLL